MPRKDWEDSTTRSRFRELVGRRCMAMCRLHHSLLLLVVAWRTCNRYLTTSTPQTLKKNKKRSPKRSTKRLENFLSLSFSLHVTPLLTFPTSTLAPPASTPTHTHTAPNPADSFRLFRLAPPPRRRALIRESFSFLAQPRAKTTTERPRPVALLRGRRAKASCVERASAIRARHGRIRVR